MLTGDRRKTYYWMSVMDRVNGAFIPQWGYSSRIGFIGKGEIRTQYKFSEINVQYQY